ncbi:hypothetical protein BGX29_001778 [Mortierella sp. GBA35]|nr:hypothetical protein BGX29_001778 [Mortierella sp. GBA35]
MQIFTEYYQLTTEGLGHVGFDTETGCHWDNPSAQRDEVSIIQMASQDVCLLFQINSIVNFAHQPFPPRLKTFLEDPSHLKLGVGAKRDAKDLDRVFKINCNGVVDLETIALKKRILERSSQDLDEMYGRPGREVYKTNAMLRWKWNAEDLQPQWVWHAAKDAFAGIAIYENMMADRVKDTYKPYEERFSMTEAELNKDVMTFLERAMGGKGRQTTLGAIETTLQKGYGRFQKMYQPQERKDDAKTTKVKKMKDADETGTRVKKERRDGGDDKTKVKKEEEPEDDKKPLELPMSHHVVLEKGHAFFFYRPKIDVDRPSSPDDVQKLYMLLSPDAATAGKKAESGGGGSGVKKEAGSGEALHRLLIIPRKALPVYEPSSNTGGRDGGGRGGNKPGARNWAFVDIASSNLATVEKKLQEYTYSTKTRGERTQASARFIAEAHNEVILGHVDPEHPLRQSSHFAYGLEVPLEPGAVQKTFNIQKEDQFLVQVKNPQIQIPATDRGAVRYATLKDKAAQLPQHLQEKFQGIRKDQVRYAPMDSTEFLDVVRTELVLLAVDTGAKEELEGLLKGLEGEVEEEVREWSEEEVEEDVGGASGLVEHAYKGLQIDEATIPDTVKSFK